MKKRLIYLIIFLVIAVAFVTSIVLIGDVNRDNNECLGLNEKACFGKLECRGFYDTLCSGDKCLPTEVFRKCEDIPRNILEKAERDKILCESTGGNWQLSKFSKPGWCSCNRLSFVENEGCK